MHNANKVPRHIGFIMDGNGRWAKERLLPRTHGHVKGANNVEKIVDHCFKKGVEVVSLYAFSTENWQRPEKEVNKIFSILENFLNKYIVKLKKHEIRLMFSGDLSKLSPALQELCLKRVEETKYFGNGIVNIALNYGSRQEIIKACNDLLKEGKTEITEKDFEKKLYTHGLPDIDLVVRTSGEQRLSNFFLYQSSYAELYFAECMWPDFSKKQLDEALKWYAHRHRRFGEV